MRRSPRIRMSGRNNGPRLIRSANRKSQVRERARARSRCRSAAGTIRSVECVVLPHQPFRRSGSRASGICEPCIAIRTGTDEFEGSSARGRSPAAACADSITEIQTSRDVGRWRGGRLFPCDHSGLRYLLRCAKERSISPLRRARWPRSVGFFPAKQFRNGGDLWQQPNLQ